MNKLIYDRKKMKGFEEFYETIYVNLGGKDNPDWEEYENLRYSADMLDEYLWGFQDDNLQFIFKNFPADVIDENTDRKDLKTYDDYKWSLIFFIIREFVKDYPNNSIEFINDEE